MRSLPFQLLFFAFLDQLDVCDKHESLSALIKVRYFCKTDLMSDKVLFFSVIHIHWACILRQMQHHPSSWALVKMNPHFIPPFHPKMVHRPVLRIGYTVHDGPSSLYLGLCTQDGQQPVNLTINQLVSSRFSTTSMKSTFARATSDADSSLQKKCRRSFKKRQPLWSPPKVFFSFLFFLSFFCPTSRHRNAVALLQTQLHYYLRSRRAAARCAVYNASCKKKKKKKNNCEAMAYAWLHVRERGRGVGGEECCRTEIIRVTCK